MLKATAEKAEKAVTAERKKVEKRKNDDAKNNRTTSPSSSRKLMHLEDAAKVAKAAAEKAAEELDSRVADAESESHRSPLARPGLITTTRHDISDMTEREALYRAILTDPTDDLPRLVYADYLDDFGDDADRDHATFIRVQIERAKVEKGESEADPVALRRRERTLFGPLARGWFSLTRSGERVHTANFALSDEEMDRDFAEWLAHRQQLDGERGGIAFACPRPPGVDRVYAEDWCDSSGKDYGFEQFNVSPAVVAVVERGFVGWVTCFRQAHWQLRRDRLVELYPVHTLYIDRPADVAGGRGLRGAARRRAQQRLLDEARREAGLPPLRVGATPKSRAR